MLAVIKHNPSYVGRRTNTRYEHAKCYVLKLSPRDKGPFEVVMISDITRRLTSRVAKHLN